MEIRKKAPQILKISTLLRRVVFLEFPLTHEFLPPCKVVLIRNTATTTANGKTQTEF